MVSFLSRLFGKTTSTDSRTGHGSAIRSSELSLYFKAAPDDPVWGEVTVDNVQLIQDAFLEILRRANLEKYHTTNSLPEDAVDIICEIANVFAEKHELNRLHILLLAHQFVDADQLMRQRYKGRWAAAMVSRSDYAPPPESYVKYISSTYFGGS
jgi:hypothetical protein